MSSTRRMDETPDGGSARKRRRGATRLSCAECRRLKLKCDRAVPCGSCIKRGCAAICPDGSLTTGQGNRFVLASTQELHEKIAELSSRVRQLEDALRVSHSQLSPNSHPLLSEELLRVKAPLQREPQIQPTGSSPTFEEEEQKPDVVDAIGSLSISDSGRTRFFGSTASSSYFLQNEEDEEPDDRLATVRNLLPDEILILTGSFPIIPMIRTASNLEVDRLKSLYWYLPDHNTAAHLRQVYYRHAAWMYDPIPVQDFNEQVFYHIYPLDGTSPVHEPLMGHRLSLMFMVLAIGTLMDTTLHPYSVEAEKFHQLGRAALFQSDLFDDPSLHAIQALFLMSFYLFLSERHGAGAGSRWAIMGMAVKLAQSIGLHRDVGKWKVDPSETRQRRGTFWELYTYDSWQCLTFGRPPSFSLSHVDCKLPHPTDDSVEQSFHAWKHKFVSDCMSIVHDQAFGAKAPTYATVLQLDRKLRAFLVPNVLQMAGFGTSQPEMRPDSYPQSVPLMLQRHVVLAIREMNLLYMHRSFFARALSDHPKDPLGSPFGTSVIAAYRSAGSLVALMRNLHSQVSDVASRIWFLWAHMFSCAIILGSIVTRCPSMSLAPSALVQLDSACELFSLTAKGFRAQRVLNIMLKLRQKAHACLEARKEGKLLPPLASQPSEPSSPDDDDELAILGGKTRVVARKDSNSPPSMRSPRSLNPIVPLPLTPGSSQLVDSNVIEYLKSFDVSVEQLSGPVLSPILGQQSTETSPYNLNTLSTMPYTPETKQGVGYVQPGLLIPPTANRNGFMPVSNFPQYFPVYDYGNSNAYPQQMDNFLDPGRGSESPQETMQTYWQALVDQMGSEH
ncbi:hypothetical protein JAAARDRAFT_204099 [Jaapia argillacea MUCL 33604]|uniref:Zn(2)-C6 fungal-type domain-containing protein n=1 Tax=Jaapia argillacea MUCL 33604 TaxID=933084 RepID=A0A067QDP6_9AGAM|nr:hypothetical protein JAAARDRAFT_204099 [Jaapia argillacea MUCL 33604]